MGGVILTLSIAALTGCQRNINLPDDSLRSDEIIFMTSDPSLSAEVSTKATAVTSLTSFNVSAVTGAAGTETAVWTNVAFSGNNDDGFKAAAPGKWWPAADASYRFYAANSALTFAASGATVAATNATDIVCAYMASPSYKAKNTLSFEHIFARLGQVTVSAASGYTISNVSIKVIPKTGGTYNLLTGAGQTDGTGWSGLATGSETVIGNAVGNTANDIYLVPGTYTLTASWTATKGDYTENIENMTCDVNLVAGKINKISTTLSGNAKEIVFNVSIAPWADNNQVVEFPTKIYSFGGLEIAAGPLMYEGGKYVIKDNWNYSSYNTAYGKTEGSTYFTISDLGKLFTSSDYSVSNGNIINNQNPLSGYRLPTINEWTSILTTDSNVRQGSKVNGIDNQHYSRILMTEGGVWFGNSYVNGLLVFPDGETIRGKELLGTDNDVITSGFTLTELDAYLNQGCVFLVNAGRYYSINTEWMNGGQYAAYPSSDVNKLGFGQATQRIVSWLNISNNFKLDYSGSNRIDDGQYYLSVRLVKDI